MVRFLSIALSTLLVVTSVHARGRVVMPPHGSHHGSHHGILPFPPPNPPNPGNPNPGNPNPGNPNPGNPNPGNPNPGTCAGYGLNNDAFGHFNAIFFGNFETGGGSGTMGPLAVGGNFTAPDSVLNANNGSNCDDNPSSIGSMGLVVGGTAITSNTQVHGNALIAGGGTLTQIRESEAGFQVTNQLGTGDFDFFAVREAALDNNEGYAYMDPTAIIEPNGAFTQFRSDADYEVITFGGCGGMQCSRDPNTESDPSNILLGSGNWNGFQPIDPNKTYVFNIPVINRGTLTLRTNDPLDSLNPCRVVWNIYPVDDRGVYLRDGEITVYRATASQLGGLIMAPEAHIIDGSTGNFAGTVVGRDYTWSDLSAGVEIHDYHAIGGACDAFQGCNPHPDHIVNECTNTLTTTSTATTTQVIPVPTTTTQVIPVTTTEEVPVPTTTTEEVPVSTTTTQVILVPTTTTEEVPVPTTTTQVIPVPTTTTEEVPVSTTTTEIVPTTTTETAIVDRPTTVISIFTQPITTTDIITTTTSMTTTVTTIETLIPTIPASVLNTGECLSVINYVLPPGTAGNTFDMYAELKDSQPITRDSCYTVCSTSPHVPNGEWYFGITDGLSISWGGTALNSQACLCFINKPPSISPNANNPPICADGRGTTQFSSWVYTVSP